MLICEVCYKKKIEKGGGKMVDTVVKVSNLTKSYGKNKVLSGVNITLERGKIYGFIGQNGAGKTTMINHINGLLFPD